MENRVKTYIEIEKHSNLKYEYDKTLNQLILDRILPYPYFYPYAYGFIPNTLAKDNDELDVLIISNYKIEKDQFYEAYIIGVLLMEDEQGVDEKILCVVDEEYDGIKDIEDLDDNVLENIHWFFSNYKKKSPGKW